jgi:hypothetical protein
MENVARTAQMRNSCLILVVKSKVTKSLGVPRSKYKILLKKTEMNYFWIWHGAYVHDETRSHEGERDSRCLYIFIHFQPGS